jgi:hypothetical protein
MTLDEALARLAEVRLAIERFEAETWCLEREREQLRATVQMLNRTPIDLPGLKDLHATP